MASPLPSLLDWDKTRISLHRASQVISAVRASVSQPLPNAQRLSLYPTREGLRTGVLPFGGDLVLDFNQLCVTYRQPGEPDARVSLNGHSQWTLAGAVVAMLSDEGHDVTIDRNKLADQTHFEMAAQTALDYARALDTIFTAAARFRARLTGPQSPIVVWPHGFDLSFLWFAHTGADEHQDPHMNFGFSPTSPGFERPYLYVYASPSPQELADVPLPPLAHLNTERWTGVIVDYDDLLGVSDPLAVIEALYDEIYRAISPFVSSVE
jgi:uncharacterized protein with PIN domain